MQMKNPTLIFYTENHSGPLQNIVKKISAGNRELVCPTLTRQNNGLNRPNKRRVNDELQEQ